MVPSNGKILQNSDKVCLAVGSLLSTLLALVISVGIKSLFSPQLSLPLQLRNDSNFFLSLVTRVSEGWHFNNVRQGFPFGSESRMFPISDNGPLLIIKCLTTIGFPAVTALNIFFLIGFPICFCVTFLVLRRFKVSSALSFSGAVLYAFLPFHFYRYEHVFHTWYFVVPVYFAIAEGLFRFKDGQQFHFSKNRSLLALVLLLSCFGVYFNVFGSILIFFGAALGCSQGNAFQLVKKTTALLVVLASGLFINLLSNIWFLLTAESSLSSSVVRSRTAGEIYSFRLIQLFLPNEDHIFPPFRSLAAAYNSSAPFVNENRTATLGILGSLGFMLLLWVLFFLPKSIGKSTLWFLASTSWMLFLIGTMGGFGSIATYFGLEMVRGWNRISVFVAFGSIAAALFSLQVLVRNYRFLLSVSIIVLSFGLLDQVGGLYIFRPENVKNQFMDSRRFVELIEDSLPRGSAVYNLPYTEFPEPDTTGGLAYENGEGFLHSEGLKWSYGGNKSTEGAEFYRNLASEPISRQLRVIRRMGFGGVYLDLRGFGSDAEQVMSDFLDLGMVPILVRADGNIVFFKIEINQTSQLKQQIKNKFDVVACYEKRPDGSFFESC
jgi:phosphoglycerol transferase